MFSHSTLEQTFTKLAGVVAENYSFWRLEEDKVIFIGK